MKYVKQFELPQMNDLFPFSVGFESLAKRLNEFNDGLSKSVPGYPPYNIKKVDENKYVIELAVAGISKNDIEITLENGVLKIAGSSSSVDDDSNYVYKGIAERAFSRTFTLADTIEVKNADMINGMLKIWLENIIPENKKPKKIDISDKENKPSSKKKEFLSE